MLRGQTKTGFSFTLREEALDDMELLEVMIAVDDDASLLPKLLRMLLGEKQKRRLYEHVRKIHGRVSIKALSEEVFSMLQGERTLKK